MNAFTKLEELQRERETIEAESMKLEQLIAAAANMLPDEHKSAVMDRLTLLREVFRLRDVGLTDAIRTILKDADGHWMTVTNIRDRLIALGFDFTGYSTNPLASISTVLRRMKPEEVETSSVDGVNTYRSTALPIIPMEMTPPPEPTPLTHNFNPSTSKLITGRK